MTGAMDAATGSDVWEPDLVRRTRFAPLVAVFKRNKKVVIVAGVVILVLVALLFVRRGRK